MENLAKKLLAKIWPIQQSIGRKSTFRLALHCLIAERKKLRWVFALFFALRCFVLLCKSFGEKWILSQALHRLLACFGFDLVCRKSKPKVAGCVLLPGFERKIKSNTKAKQSSQNSALKQRQKHKTQQTHKEAKKWQQTAKVCSFVVECLNGKGELSCELKPKTRKQLKMKCRKLSCDLRNLESTFCRLFRDTTKQQQNNNNNNITTTKALFGLNRVFFDLRSAN